MRQRGLGLSWRGRSGRKEREQRERERTHCAAANEYGGELVHRQAGLLGHERLESFVRQHRVNTDEPGFAFLWRHHPSEVKSGLAVEACFG